MTAPLPQGPQIFDKINPFLAAAWLVAQRAAYAGDPQFGVHIGSENFWADVITRMQDSPCTFYAVGATKDDHVNHWDSFSHPWVTDVLDYNGNYLLPALPMQFPYLMVVDEPNLCYNETYPWLGPDCGQGVGVMGLEDGMWQDELVFWFWDMSNYFDTYYPPQAVRFRAWDDLGNWKRTDNLLENLLDNLTGSFEVTDLAFYDIVNSVGTRRTYCGSPSVERGVSGICTLNVAAKMDVIQPCITPQWVETYVSNDTDENRPPGSAEVVCLPLYKVPRYTALYYDLCEVFFEDPNQCSVEFYSRGDEVDCSPLIVDDYEITQSPTSVYDKWTQPVLWVSNRENPAWFSAEERKDSTNVYSCDHSWGNKRSPPVLYGQYRGVYMDGCDPQNNIRNNSVEDLKQAGVAHLTAFLPSLLETDIGVQSESDLLFINSHFTSQSNPADWQGFSPFQASESPSGYPGDCPPTGNPSSPIWDIRWFDFFGNFEADCDWIATTGCESLNFNDDADDSEGLPAAVQLIHAGLLSSIAGFHITDNRAINYQAVFEYNYRLNTCDGSFTWAFWAVPPATTDCNIIAWMENYCAFTRGEPYDVEYKGLRHKHNSFARAVDNTYYYSITYPVSWEEFSYYNMRPNKNQIKIIYAPHYM